MTHSEEYAAIKNIKTLGHAKRACDALLEIAARVEGASNSAFLKNNNAEKRASENFKAGGVAYYKDIALSYANFIFDKECGHAVSHSPLASRKFENVERKIAEQYAVSRRTVEAIDSAK